MNVCTSRATPISGVCGPALLMMAALVALSAGCAKKSGVAPAGSAAAPAPARALPPLGDAAHGKSIYVANCSSCHGASGSEGGIGPSLKNEKSRKDEHATVAWIKNPSPPMPKLFPSVLSEKDVADVAAFVQTL